MTILQEEKPHCWFENQTWTTVFTNTVLAHINEFKTILV